MEKMIAINKALKDEFDNVKDILKEENPGERITTNVAFEALLDAFDAQRKAKRRRKVA